MLLFYISSIVITLFSFLWIAKKWFSHEDWKTIGPFGVLLLCFSAYCGFGPMLVTSFTGKASLYGIVYSDYATMSAGMSLVSFLFVVIGYSLTKTQRPSPQERICFLPPKYPIRAWHCGLFAYGLAWTAMLIARRFNIVNMYNAFGGELTAYSNIYDLGGAQNYVAKFGESLQGITIFLFSLSFFLGFRQKIIAWALLANSSLLIMATGFRQQLAFLFLCVILTFILSLRSKQDWFMGGKKKLFVRASLIASSLFFLISAMSIGRSYGRGVDFNKLEGVTTADIIVAPFSETAGVYFCGGAVAETAQTHGEFSYFRPILSSLLMPIPRVLVGDWKDVRGASIVATNFLSENGAGGVGMAFIAPTDIFLMFGWAGLIFVSFFWGHLCKKLENYKVKRRDFIASLLYVLMSGYVFIYFHRGWMPQQMTSLVFLVLMPIIVLKAINYFQRFDIKRIKLFSKKHNHL